MTDAAHKNKFISLLHSRSEVQHEVMKKIDDDGVCPFCPENLTEYHKAPIIKEGEYWYLTDNQWPYDKVKNQLLAIHKAHIEHISELSPEAGAELIQFFGEEARKRGIQGGGLAMRFGSSDLGNYGSSVLHLHAHLIEPDLARLEESEAWRFKFGQPKNYKKKTA